jgi:tetratricopeptide (TPR) repeat protein
MISMSSVRLVMVAVAWCLLVAAVEVSAEPTWRRLVTPHFTLVGEVGERQLRDVARRLEEFSEVVGRMLPRARITPPAPATVIVFGSRSSLKAFVPRFDGTTRVDIAGYFLPGRDRYYIGLLHGGGDAAYRVVYHELAHLIVNNTTPDVPVWFSEGLAEFYSTFELSANGRQGSIGRVVPEHVHLLRDRFMPLGQLFRVTRESKEYNERDRVSVFYAQSWALVHYLLNGRPERTPQMFAFLDRQRQGVPVDAAFAESFDVGVDTLERELRNYVGQQRFVFQNFRLDDALIGERYAVEVLPAAAVDAVLGGLLARLDRPDEARARLERALVADGQLSEAHAALAWIAVREGDRAQALDHVARAIESDPDNGHAHALYGLVVASDGTSLEDPATHDTARRVLTRATVLGPEWPDPWFLLARVQAAAGATDEARASIERAMGLAPGRLEYRCTSNSTPPRRSPFLDGASLPEALVERAARSAIRRSRCSIATACTARRGSTRRRSAPASRRIVGAELTLADSGRSGRSASAAAVAAARARGVARRLPQPVPARHADEAARAEGRGRARARRSRRPGRRARRARRARGAHRPSATASAGCSIVSSASSARRTCTSSCSATCCATRSRQPGAAAIWPPRSRAGGGHQRRPVRRRPDERPLYDVLTCIRHKTTLERRRGGGWRPTPSGT